MTEKPTVTEALAAVMAEVSHVTKSDFNQHQRFNFRGVDAVVNAAGPAFRKHGVIILPEADSGTIEYQVVQTTTGKPSTACRIRMGYRVYGPAGDSLPLSVFGEAWDAGDKATPKAMSVCYRTALLQALCLPTDEPDPDSHTYEQAPSPPSAGERILAHHNGDMTAATAAAANAGFNLINPDDREKYADWLTANPALTEGAA